MGHRTFKARQDLIEQAQREEIRQRVHMLAPQATWMEVSFGPSHLFTASGRTKTLDSISDHRDELNIPVSGNFRKRDKSEGARH